jgi:hypothetical protein
MDPSPVGEWLLFESQKLVEIKIFVKNDDWAKTKYDLTEKLGQPVSEVPQVFQNALGARWEYPEGFWLKGNTVAVARVKVSNEPKTFAILSPADQPITHGIEITITDSDRAKLPSKTPNSLD